MTENVYIILNTLDEIEEIEFQNLLNIDTVNTYNNIPANTYSKYNFVADENNINITIIYPNGIDNPDFKSFTLLQDVFDNWIGNNTVSISDRVVLNVGDVIFTPELKTGLQPRPDDDNDTNTYGSKSDWNIFVPDTESTDLNNNGYFTYNSTTGTIVVTQAGADAFANDPNSLVGTLAIHAGHNDKGVAVGGCLNGYMELVIT